MRVKVHLSQRTDFSGRQRIDVEPVDFADEDFVASAVAKIIEVEFQAKKVNLVEGLDQTYIDYMVGEIPIEVVGDPFYFLSIATPDADLRKRLWDRLSSEFEVVPREVDGDDD